MTAPVRELDTGNLLFVVVVPAGRPTLPACSTGSVIARIA
ncbi:Hypothetical protein A7982_04365 [Minicystis rosea]|nr:Hypothetical protein A7982_04365 [Minicystis rosea]